MSSITKWAKPHFLNPAWWAEPLRPGTPVVSIFQTHQAWAKDQVPFSKAALALAQVALNPAVHRCRIGKITVGHDA